MADGRDIACWDNHARECEEAGREPFLIDSDTRKWLKGKLDGLENVYECLDVGCGPCYWVRLFEGKQYNAIDQSPGMLDLAKRVLTRNDLLGGVGEIRLGNARQLKEIYEPNSFDLVFTSSVLMHNRHEPDKREAVEGIHYILRDRGYLLCTENTFRADNAPESVGQPDYTDGNSFTPEGWKKFMDNLGFELLDFSGKSEYLYRRK